MNIVIFLGSRDLLGAKVRPANVFETVSSLNRQAVVRMSVRVLNSLAYDLKTGFHSAQDVLIDFLPAAAKQRYTEIVRSEDTPIRLFHPLQQLALIHLAARYGQSEGGMNLSIPEGRERWATACLQINDQFPRNPLPPPGMPLKEKVLHFPAEQLGIWELTNWINPFMSLGRLLFMFNEVPRLGAQYAEAAARLKERFPKYLGLDFETAFNLTAFPVLWWEAQAPKIPTDPDAALINRRTWLENTTIPTEVFDIYLKAFSTCLEAIPAEFDVLKGETSFHEVLPFRRRPLLRIDEDGIAFLCPQLLAEKGGIDLLWALTHDPGGSKEEIHWTQDFGLLYEGYVRAVFSNLGARAGGRYVSDVSWRLSDSNAGQIDGLLGAGRHLVVTEVKGSMVRQMAKTRGTAADLEAELRRKFIVGVGPKRKGIRQLVHAIQWLNRERRESRRVADFDLREVEVILPVLVVADRALRFPRLGEWFDSEMRSMVGEASMPWRIGALAICGLEDLENLEQESAAGRTTFLQALIQYDFQSLNGERTLWETYDRQLEPHARLSAFFEAWLADLQARGIVLR